MFDLSISFNNINSSGDKASNKLSSISATTPNKELATSSTNKETVTISVSDCQIVEQGNKQTDQLNTNLNKNSNSNVNIGTSSTTKDAVPYNSNTLTAGGSFRSKGHAKSASMSCSGRNETNLTKNNLQNQSNNAELNTTNILISSPTETDRPRY